MSTDAVAPTQNVTDVRVENLRRRRAKIFQGDGKERIDKQHAAGKLTARERVDKLVDQASFQEIGIFANHRSTYFGMADKEIPADGVITGCAAADGRTVI
jgi:methylmalonyl-CoA carboxyltransferase large subunit